MQVEVFTIADAATESQGKLNILGTFDTIFAKTTPVVWPLCAIAAKIRVFKGDGEKHIISVRIRDQEGKDTIPPPSFDLNVLFKPYARFASANIIMHLQGLKFDNYGEYLIALAVDGVEMITIPVLIAQPVEASGQPVETSGQPVEDSGQPVEASGQPVEASG